MMKGLWMKTDLWDKESYLVTKTLTILMHWVDLLTKWTKLLSEVLQYRFNLVTYCNNNTGLLQYPTARNMHMQAHSRICNTTTIIAFMVTMAYCDVVTDISVLGFLFFHRKLGRKWVCFAFFKAPLSITKALYEGQSSAVSDTHKSHVYLIMSGWTCLTELVQGTFKQALCTQQLYVNSCSIQVQAWINKL